MTDLPPGKEAELVERIRAIDARAPDSLHDRVQLMIEGGSSGRAKLAGRSQRRSRLGPRVAAVGGLCAAAIAALVIGLSSGTTHSLSVHQASALTLARSTAAAPAESQRRNGTLTAAVDGVSFPYWEDRFGWRSTGTRTDRIAGRTIQTVYYADRGRRIGYAIVGGSSAPQLASGKTVWLGGRPYNVSTINGHPVITWLRDGHLCIVSGRGVDSATLLRLASWTDDDTLA